MYNEIMFSDSLAQLKAQNPKPSNVYQNTCTLPSHKLT